MKIRLFIGLLWTIILLSACGGKKQVPVDIPEVLINEEKMAEIVSEVQLIEAYLNEIPYGSRGKNDSDYVYYPLLFEKYQITKEVFLDNLAYYSQNEEKIYSIYDKSIIILNKIKAKDIEIRLEMKLDSIRQDSIRGEREKFILDSLKETLQEAKNVRI
ncbi:MAG: DUF4296 domain-containing protein [Bacteroidales bacterium]|jgi:hypothetical protein|nr:DUF4296 domain-containing protein [Bacteroidales bacterium]